MKLKNILIGIGLITSLQGVQSCIDDRGNYSYISNEELLPVTISGFEDTTVIIRSTLNITPVLENMDDESVTYTCGMHLLLKQRDLLHNEILFP
ncbi:MAG: hypothetical protein ACLU4J_13610 [Butyricimonas paravirosa]